MNFDGVELIYPFGKEIAVYSINSDKDKMFALIKVDSDPLQLSLKCDPQLAEKLREDYETVLPGFNLNSKYWNTILCTGQVPQDEIKSLITISYNLVNSKYFN